MSTQHILDYYQNHFLSSEEGKKVNQKVNKTMPHIQTAIQQHVDIHNALVKQMKQKK